MKKETWKTVFQIVLSILTAIAASLGVTSCMPQSCTRNLKLTNHPKITTKRRERRRSLLFLCYLKKILPYISKILFYAINNNISHYTSFQSTNPFPISSSSMARAITLRLSALKGSAYCLAFICSVAASTPPLLLSFNSSTQMKLVVSTTMSILPVAIIFSTIT